MNKAGILFVFLVWFAGINSYSQTYAKYIEKGKVWKSTYYYFRSKPCASYAQKVYYVGADTIINSKVYSIIKTFTMPVNYTAPASCTFTYENQQQNTSIFAFVREDTILHKVYSIEYLNGSWKEGLFLDFNLKIGDSIPVKYTKDYITPYPKVKGDTSGFSKVYEVDSTINAKGKISRKIHFANSSNKFWYIGDNNFWNEGEGGYGDPSGNLYRYEMYMAVIMEESTTNNKVENGVLIMSLNEESKNTPDEFIPNGFKNIAVYNTMGIMLKNITTMDEFWPSINNLTEELLILHIKTDSYAQIKKLVISR